MNANLPYNKTWKALLIIDTTKFPHHKVKKQHFKKSIAKKKKKKRVAGFTRVRKRVE